MYINAGELTMTDDEQNGNQPLEGSEQLKKRTAKEKLKDSGFIDMTRPGSGSAFIGGVRSPKQHGDE